MLPAATFSRLCALSPVTFDELRRELDGAVESFSNGSRARQLAAAHWEGPNAAVIQLDVPGFTESQLSVHVEDRILKVSGNREIPSMTGELRRSEGQYGEFSRSFQLPETLDTTAVSAELSNGVLTLTIPRKVTAQPSRIPVRVRSAAPQAS